jgi:hypothetical protein
MNLHVQLPPLLRLTVLPLLYEPEQRTLGQLTATGVLGLLRVTANGVELMLLVQIGLHHLRLLRVANYRHGSPMFALHPQIIFINFQIQL